MARGPRSRECIWHTATICGTCVASTAISSRSHTVNPSVLPSGKGSIFFVKSLPFGGKSIKAGYFFFLKNPVGANLQAGKRLFSLPLHPRVKNTTPPRSRTPTWTISTSNTWEGKGKKAARGDAWPLPMIMVMVKAPTPKTKRENTPREYPQRPLTFNIKIARKSLF